MNNWQGYISRSLVGLDFKTKYGLSDYTDRSAPLVMFGMYDDEDLHTYRTHKGELSLVWQGMDSKDLNGRAGSLKKREATHYSISHWITESLDKHDIQSTYAPISATSGKSKPTRKGNSIYFYTSNLSQESSDYYGTPMIKEIEERTGLDIIVATYETYTKEQLFNEIYPKCFINLRLTTYDGLPNTNLEMGLLGRKSIFNGNIPGSIKWRSVTDICNSIMYEFYRRSLISYDIADITEIFCNSTNNIFK